MNGWQWFWTLVGFIVYIVVLIFLYFFEPFEALFNTVINGISYDNAIFWAVLIIGIIGFCAFHWRAYRLHIVQQNSIEAMVMSSLRGSTFTAILLSAGATLQSVQILCRYLLRDGYSLGAEFGEHLIAIILLLLLTIVFCVIFLLLRNIRQAQRA